MSPTPRYLSRILLVLIAGAAFMAVVDRGRDCGATTTGHCHRPAAWSSLHDD